MGIHIMKVFALAALVALVSADAQVPFTAFASGPLVAHAPAAVHHAIHAPVHHAIHAPVLHHAVHAPVHHAVVHHAPVHHAVHHDVHHAPAYHQPHYGYEKPKHNCSVVDVVESAEICTPAFETVCENIEIPTKIIIDVEQCYPVTRTVCTESVSVIDNEMATVCQPTPGYGYHSYGHNYCKEVAQGTCYNVPVVTVVEPAVQVAFPEPIKTCVNKPINLIVISCEDLTAEKCITVPEVEE